MKVGMIASEGEKNLLVESKFLCCHCGAGRNLTCSSKTQGGESCRECSRVSAAPRPGQQGLFVNRVVAFAGWTFIYVSFLCVCDRITALPTGVLQIYGVEQKDAGNYRCVATTIANRRKSAEAVLSVIPGTHHVSRCQWHYILLYVTAKLPTCFEEL